ncbi:thiopurine S-methyltransferase [Hansschlegelia plantiphila]|uniref:Thiopurine S-methyltransferase n=1 Tax=Hansschlegelia plantiphila TaxID=374655 RepID=A0A9W6MWQ9_9HYPH|nr:thiopurine S-methyltransferase [Hansschlegelia plantiphila]GLK69115.1 thiopurine S-methyltransferase [Hansschlegelia plantiphila]
MDDDFWRRKWRDGAIGFHQPAPNPLLLTHLPAIGLKAGARVFAPLCGKSLDLGWLRGRGFRVVGVELVGEAVEQLFQEAGVIPEIERFGDLSCYRTDGIDVFVGDVFALDRETLGAVDAVWDRAALIALPQPIRSRYAAHVIATSAGAQQLLVTLDYDQTLMDGPPFAVSDEEVRALYADAYDVALLASAEVEGGLKGTCPATETAWLLRAT